MWLARFPRFHVGTFASAQRLVAESRELIWCETQSLPSCGPQQPAWSQLALRLKLRIDPRLKSAPWMHKIGWSAC